MIIYIYYFGMVDLIDFFILMLLNKRRKINLIEYGILFFFLMIRVEGVLNVFMYY